MARPSATSIEGNALPLPGEMAPAISLTPIVPVERGGPQAKRPAARERLLTGLVRFTLEGIRGLSRLETNTN